MMDTAEGLVFGIIAGLALWVAIILVVATLVS